MKIHDVQMIDFEGTKMILTVDGQAYRVDLPSISARLADAKDAARRSYSISPSGYGVHWPDIDEDLTIDGLIAAARPAQTKKEAAPLVLKEDRAKEVSSLRDHLRHVIIHVQKTREQFRGLTVHGLKTMPIPFFGDVEKAEILTVGVSPAASEFNRNRKWRQTEATPEYLEARLTKYFDVTDPPPHSWFSPWEESLKMLNGGSYRKNAAHLDLSPQATATIPKDDRACDNFLEMIESDLPIFFDTISLCRAAKVLLIAGSVTKRFYINEFLQEHAPRFGYELNGEFQRRPGGLMTCRHDLVSKDKLFRLPVFFFSRGPKHPNYLIRLVRQESKVICDCLNDL
jgi:Protein of unknown function (DUF2442)